MKVLGVAFSTNLDSICLTAGNIPSIPTLAKRALSSEIAIQHTGFVFPTCHKVKLSYNDFGRQGLTGMTLPLKRLGLCARNGRKSFLYSGAT